MNKIKYLIVALFTVGLVHGQDELNLPNYTPPSPEASAMTKYADLQANEFRGMVSHTIPLHTFKAGQLEVPISISYNGAGVRVDDIPTWVGMNWTLNAGGVITRTVKDLPDESVMQRLMPTEADIIAYNSVADGTSEGNFLWNVAESSQQIDSEVDVFQFNFNGYSGSFYLDENWVGRPFYDENNLKIWAGGLNTSGREGFYFEKYIFIVTPDGVKYTFGGANATEDTTLRYVVDGSVTPGDTNQGTTAFYLISVEHPIHGEINFTYDSLDIEILTTQKIQKLRKTSQYEYTLHHGNCGNYAPGGCNEDINKFDCVNREDIDNNFTNITISSRVLNPKYLNRISSPFTGEVITFNSEGVDNPSFKRVLNSIIIDRDGDEANQPFKTVDFEYLGFSANPHPFATTRYAQKRFFLTKIVFDKDVNYAVNTQNGRRNQVYEFEYDSPNSLPVRFDYAQDYGGFYNGISNSTSIPDNIAFNPFGLLSLADRSPNLTYAQMGTLKKIKYPTGGFTELEYEAASKAKKKQNKSIGLQAYRNFENRIPRSHLSNGIPQVLPEEQGGVLGVFNVYESQSVPINVLLRAHLDTGSPIITSQNERATLTVTDLTTNTVVRSRLLTMTSGSNNLVNAGVVDKEFTVTVGFTEGHDYGVEIEIYPTTVTNPTATSPIPLEAFVSFSYNDGYEVVDDFGVRLKRMTDFAKDSQAENVKRYYYDTIENINSPIDLNSLPILGEGSKYTNQKNYASNKICQVNAGQCECGLPPLSLELWYYHSELSSEKIDFNSPGYSNYEYVTLSFGGDNFEKGGVEKRFKLADNYGGSKIYTDLSGNPSSYMHSFIDELSSSTMSNSINITNPLSGTLLHEKHFKKDGASLKKVLCNEMVYTTIEDRVVRNIFAKKEYDALFFETGESSDNTISNFTLASYKIPSLRHELTQKQTIEYIDPVPLGVTDESGYKKIVSVEDYQYGFYKGLPTKIITQGSDGSIIEVYNYYVDQVSNTDYQDGLTANQIQAAQDLQSQHIINNAIMTEKIRDFKTLNRVRTIYKDLNFELPNPRIVPHIIQSDKGDELGSEFEDRVIFHEYDNSGRPTLVSKANGTQTRYWYNGLGQVIMKADNFVAGAGGLITPAGVEQEINTDPCAYLSNFSSEVQVSLYKYDPATHLLIEIIDSKCDSLHYIYDDLHRLQMIKDKDGNILQEFDSSFKRY